MSYIIFFYQDKQQCFISIFLFSAAKTRPHSELNVQLSKHCYYTNSSVFITILTTALCTLAVHKQLSVCHMFGKNIYSHHTVLIKHLLKLKCSCTFILYSM